MKTSLAPGSKVVTEYLDRAGLTEPLERLGFNLVGYGCTTCIGNSGPLPEEISKVVGEQDLAVVSVLSGNRNFEGRINPDVKMNYLASPPLCVAYALAGTMDIDIVADPLGRDAEGREVYLRDIWPTEREIAQTIEAAVQSDMFRKSYAEVFAGDEHWNGLEVPRGERFAWDERSTYVAPAPLLRGDAPEPAPIEDLQAPACWRCGATPSPPTTSPPRARSSATDPPGSTCRSRGWRRATSTPSAPAAATTR